MFNCLYFEQEKHVQDCKNFNSDKSKAQVLWDHHWFDGEIWFTGNLADSEAKMHGKAEARCHFL
jgi:hypothetical protein